MRLIEPLEAEVCRRLGARVFGFDAEAIERVVLRMVGENGWTLGTAESATGGMIAAELTSVPGASSVFRGGIIAYDQDAKASRLGVGRDVMQEHGVVSPETAIAMAEGAAERLGVDVAVAVTGSAGPDVQEQPAGTMIFAVRTPEDVRSKTLGLPGDRERVRTYATTAALHFVRLAVSGSGGASRQALCGRCPQRRRPPRPGCAPRRHLGRYAIARQAGNPAKLAPHAAFSRQDEREGI